MTAKPETWVSRWTWGRGHKHMAIVAVQVTTEGIVFLMAVLLAYVMQAGWPASMGPFQRTFWTTVPSLLSVARSPEFSVYLPLLVLSPVLRLVTLQWLGLYLDETSETRPFAATFTIFKGVILGSAALVTLAVAYRGALDTGEIIDLQFFFLYEGIVAFLGITLVHSASLIGVLCLLAWGIGLKRVAIVQGEERWTALVDALNEPTTEYHLRGIITSSDSDSQENLGATWLGTLGDLQAVINEHNLDELILAVDPGALSAADRLDVAQTCWRMGTDLKMVAPFQPFFQTTTHTESVGDVSLLRVQNLGLYASVPQILKRVMDLVIALVTLLILSPLMVLISLAIKMGSRGPVFFVQERVGLNGRTFGMIKFRSMRADTDTSTHQAYLKQLIQGNETGEIDDKGNRVYKMAQDPRVTRVGRFIRRTSMDELPQLFNVLRGEMSLVGPRPPIQYEVDEYQERHMRRLHIRPGITGLWQVSGRSRLSFEQMIQLDIRYIERWSLLLDIKILILTLPAVLNTRDAY